MDLSGYKPFLAPKYLAHVCPELYSYFAVAITMGKVSTDESVQISSHYWVLFSTESTGAF